MSNWGVLGRWKTVDGGVRLFVAALVVSIGLLLAACGDADGVSDNGSDSGNTEQFTVVATTTHIADFARNVAGDRAAVISLLPANADAHDFEPTPRDVERVADADLILRHGMDLDVWATSLVSESGSSAPVVVVTDGVSVIEHDDDDHADDDDHDDEHDDHDDDRDDDHHHEGDDPHVWLDVANAKVMVINVRDALVDFDPEGRATYEANAEQYIAELDDLDAWIREQVATIPDGQRKLVTSHDAFGYYVRAYGFEFVGAIIPSLDSQAQPSAQETARLIDLIREENVRAIFTEQAINPNLANSIAAETDAVVVDSLYGDSLGEAGSGADTYIGMMRVNTTTIVEALRQ